MMVWELQSVHLMASQTLLLLMTRLVRDIWELLHNTFVIPFLYSVHGTEAVGLVSEIALEHDVADNCCLIAATCLCSLFPRTIFD